MGAPLVSVIMTAYRHAKYIEQAVESCLSQTLQDIEVIVIDDGSDDGTLEKIFRFRDPRLITVRQENAGPSLAFNRGLATTRAPYIALMSGDDVCLPDRLEKQIFTMELTKADAVFGRPILINEEGNVLSDTNLPVFFSVAPESSEDLLRKLFFKSNFLCATGGMVRRSAFEACGGFHPALYQLQDFDMWLRLCCRRTVHLSNDRVVKYRIRDGEANLSSRLNSSRMLIEYAWIYRRLLRDLDANMLETVFSSDLQLWGAQNSPVEDQKILIFLLHPDSRIRRHGFEHLIDKFENLAGQSDEVTFAGLTIKARDLAAVLAVMA